MSEPIYPSETRFCAVCKQETVHTIHGVYIQTPNFLRLPALNCARCSVCSHYQIDADGHTVYTQAPTP